MVLTTEIKGTLKGGAARKIVIAAASRLSALISGILIVPLSVRYLSPHEFTYWALLSTIVGGLSLLDLGLSGSVVNSLLRQDELSATLAAQRALGAVRQTRKALGPVSVAVFVAGIALAIAASHVAMGRNSLGVPGFIAAAAAGMGVLFSGSTNVLIALRKVNHYYVVTGLASILQLAACAIVVLVKPSVTTLLVIPIVSLLGAPLLSMGLLRVWAYGGRQVLNWKRKEPIEEVRTSGNGAAAYQLANLGGAGMQYAPAWLLASLSTPLAVAQFQLGQKAFGVIFGFMHLFMSDHWVQAFSSEASPRALSIEVRRALYLSVALCAVMACTLSFALPSVTNGVSIGLISLLLWTGWVATQTYGLSLFYAASSRQLYRLQERSAVATVASSFALCALGAMVDGAVGAISGIIAGYFLCSVLPYLIVVYGKFSSLLPRERVVPQKVGG
jgi:hypothetical protein